MDHTPYSLARCPCFASTIIWPGIRDTGINHRPWIYPLMSTFVVMFKLSFSLQSGGLLGWQIQIRHPPTSVEVKYHTVPQTNTYHRKSMLLLLSLKYKRNCPRKWHYGLKHIQRNISFTVWDISYFMSFSHPFPALPICAYRSKTTQMCTKISMSAENSTHWCISRIASYLRLVVLAIGFQSTANTQGGLCRDSVILLKSIHTAREVIQIMVEHLYPTGNLRFAMDSNFLYVSFAAAFLINVS